MSNMRLLAVIITKILSIETAISKQFLLPKKHNEKMKMILLWFQEKVNSIILSYLSMNHMISKICLTFLFQLSTALGKFPIICVMKQNMSSNKYRIKNCYILFCPKVGSSSKQQIFLIWCQFEFVFENSQFNLIDFCISGRGRRVFFSIYPIILFFMHRSVTKRYSYSYIICRHL